MTGQAASRYLADRCIAQQPAARLATRTGGRLPQAMEADVRALTAVANGSGSGEGLRRTGIVVSAFPQPYRAVPPLVSTSPGAK